MAEPTETEKPIIQFEAPQTEKPLQQPEIVEALLFPPLKGVSTTVGIAGVEGKNQHGGRGVVGDAPNPNGIGVFGRGGRLAGKFEGNVEVTGKLSVAGEDIQNAIQSLIQQINSLEQRVANIEHPPPPAPTPRRGPGKGKGTGG
jgi:hypothetical protein